MASQLPVDTPGGKIRAPSKRATDRRARPRTRLVTGPTTAMASSSTGASGMCSIRDRPPMGSRRMSWTVAPRRRPTTQWAVLWTSTEANRPATHKRPSTMARGPWCQ